MQPSFGYRQRHAAKISYDSASSHHPISPSVTARNLQRSISPKPAQKGITFSGLHRSISPGTSATPSSSSTSAFSRQSFSQVSQKSLNLSTMRQQQQTSSGFQRQATSPLSRSKSPNNIQLKPPANPFSQRPLIPSSDEQYTQTYHIVNPNNFLSTKAPSPKSNNLPFSSSRSPLGRTLLSQLNPQNIIQDNKPKSKLNSQRNNSTKQLNSIPNCSQKTPEKTNPSPKQSYPSSTKHRSITPKSPFNSFKQSNYQPQQRMTDSRRSLSPNTFSAKPFESLKVSQQKSSQQQYPPSQTTKKIQYCTRLSPQKFQLSSHKELKPFSKSPVGVGAIFIDTGSDNQEEIISPRFDFSSENQSNTKAQKLPVLESVSSALTCDSRPTTVHFSTEITESNRSACCPSSQSNRNGFQKIQASMLFKQTGEQLQILQNNQRNQVKNAQTNRNSEIINELAREINMEKQITMNEMEYLLKQLRKYQALNTSKSQYLKEQEQQDTQDTKMIIESQKQTIRELIEEVDRQQEAFDQLSKAYTEQQSDIVLA